jgi:hypothetical protein
LTRLANLLRKENKKLRELLLIYESEREEYEKKWRRFDEDSIGEEESPIDKGLTEDGLVANRLKSFHRRQNMDSNKNDDVRTSLALFAEASSVSNKDSFNDDTFKKFSLNSNSNGVVLEEKKLISEFMQNFNLKPNSPQELSPYNLSVMGVEKRLFGEKISNYYLEVKVLVRNISVTKNPLRITSLSFLPHKSNENS